MLLSLLIFHFSFYASSSKRVSSSSFVLIWFSSFPFPSGFCLLIRLVGVGSSRLRQEERRRNNLNFGIQKLDKSCSGKYQID
ncbi:hypothetical protein Csa_004333 [Cucumis sativus]|uniref:Uncharacterized protein n=1 Tax=Cucumis sativus TaxID=3659 RepID=A0A0A0KDY7_CUCSA|nr:hypothetical protein Csa_004333 [Cucumis sativus]